MRRLFVVLMLSLCFALPVTAHADTIQYTLNWDFPHISSDNTSAFMGTYTFTVDSLLTGDTFVYGPGFTDTPFPGYTYVYAPDFTVPVGSNVSQIGIFYYPDYTPYNSIGIKSLYGFDLYQKAGGAAVSTGVIQDPTDPNYFYANYGDGSGDYVSMQITDLSTSPIPEPSSITLLGVGTLAIGSRIYRRTVQNRKSRAAQI